MKAADLRSTDHYLGVGYFVHPVPLFAVLVLVLNDHYLKWNFASGFTGKLSDVAGVFFFPLFLCALVCLGLNLVRRDRFYWINRRLLVGMILFTVMVFSAVKMVPLVTQAYVQMLGALGFPSVVVRDASDLWALLVCPLTYWFGCRFIE